MKSPCRSFACVHLLLAVAGLGLAGCTVGPDYQRPTSTPIPDLWRQATAADLEAGPNCLGQWWTHFNDPLLNELIALARVNNYDLKIAQARIREARALRGFAAGQYYPDIDATGLYQRNRISEGLASAIPPPGDRDDDLNSYGLDATWEIDLWGRIARSVESAQANLEASVEDYRDVLVLLYADLAGSYVRLRTIQQRLEYAHANVQTQQTTLQLVQNRYDAELAGELDVQQATLNLAITRALIPQLEQLLYQTMHRIAVLTAEPSAPLYAQLAPTAPLPEPTEFPRLGLPVDLLRQRPDIRRAKRALAAQTARIGIATADLYPQLSLSGVFAYEALQFENTFRSSSISYALGPAVRWNIFDGDRIRSQILVEDARTEQALNDYHATVLAAWEDVENALVAYEQQVRRRAELRRSVNAVQRSVELVQTLYRTGVTDFQNVQTTEQALAQQQDALAVSEGAVLQNLIRLYRALGGGWEIPCPPVIQTASSTPKDQP